MTIADQITRLNNAKANIKQAIENKGVTVSDSALLDEYPALISSIPMEGGDHYYEELYNLRTQNGTNMDGMFARTSGELDLRRLDVSNVTSMKYMFDNSLASVNIDGWDTSNVTDMSYMLYYFTGSIDISKLDTSNVTSVGFMFYYGNTDKTILTGLSFPKCTKLDSMFHSASGTTLDLSSWDISNITSMSSMFNSAKYTRIDLSGWNTSHVTNMGSMFQTYSNPLVELIIPDWDMSKVSTNIFYNSSYISKLMLIDLSRSNDATITKIASYLPTRTTTTYGTVLVPENTSQAAYDALVAKYWVPIGAVLSPAPTTIEIASELDEVAPGKSTKVGLGVYEPWNADPGKVEIIMVSDSSIATIDEDNIVTSTGVLGDIVLEARVIDTQEVVGTKTIAVSEIDNYPNQIRVRITGSPSSSTTVFKVNGSNVAFNKLTKAIDDLYSYDAGVPITKISFDQSYVYSIVKLNISNITDLTNAFYSSAIKHICTETFDTGHVTNMSGMFSSCSKLTSLDLSSFDTSSVTNMSSMFYNCSKLTSLDLSNFDTSSVTNTWQMFYNCKKLEILDIRNFDMSSIYIVPGAIDSRGQMFANCTSLHTIRLDNCSNDSINMILSSYYFPTDIIEGVTRTIYCKESEAQGLTPPTNWVFSYVIEEEPDICGNCGLPADECTCVPCEQCGAYDCDGTCTPCEYCTIYGCTGTCQDPCPYCGEVGCGGSCAQCENCGINGCDGSCAYCEQCGMYHDPGNSCPETE